MHVASTAGSLERRLQQPAAATDGKSGCIADSMTEVFFSWGGKKAQTFNVIYRGPAEFAPGQGKWTAPTRAALAGATTAHIEERRDMQRRVGLTVPSCKSCQDTLFMARCDIEGRSCK